MEGTAATIVLVRYKSLIIYYTSTAVDALHMQGYNRRSSCWAGPTIDPHTVRLGASTFEPYAKGPSRTDLTERDTSHVPLVGLWWVNLIGPQDPLIVQTIDSLTYKAIA